MILVVYGKKSLEEIAALGVAFPLAKAVLFFVLFIESFSLGITRSGSANPLVNLLPAKLPEPAHLQGEKGTFNFSRCRSELITA